MTEAVQEQTVEQRICEAWEAGAYADVIAAAARVPIVRVSQIVLPHGRDGRDHRGARVPFADLVAANEAWRTEPRRLRTQPEIDAALARIADHVARSRRAA